MRDRGFAAPEVGARLLAPAAMLLRQLPVWGKVAVVAVLLALPLALALPATISVARNGERTTLRELSGLPSAVSLNYLALALGRCAAGESTGTFSSPGLARAVRSVDRSLAEARVSRGLREHWSDLRRSLLAGKKDGCPSYATLRTENENGETPLHSLVHLSQHLADDTALSLDGHRDTLYLQSMLTVHLPRLTTGMVQVHGALSAGFTGSRLAADALAPAILAHGSAERLSGVLRHAELQPRSAVAREARSSLAALQRWTGQQSEAVRVASRDDFSASPGIDIQAPQQFAAVERLVELANSELSARLEARAAQQRQAWMWPTAVAVSAIAVVLYLMLALAWSISRDLREIQAALLAAVTGRRRRGTAPSGRDELRSVNAAVARASDEVAALLGQLRRQAFQDDLTSLANRAMFVRRLHEALEHAVETGAGLAVCVLDLDRFKEVNDTHGHSVGDDLIRVAAERFAAAVRPQDVIGRLGGDEFGVLLEDVTLEEALAAAERVSASLREPIVAGGVSLFAAVSTGVAMMHGGSRTADQLLHEADMAMYNAKASGRGQVRVFRDEMLLTDPRMARAELQALLEDPHGVEMHFQPICELGSAGILGYEALARFPGREHRHVNAWFDLARTCGMGPALEARALRLALARADRPVGTYLGVNVSPSTILSAEVQDALDGDLTGIVVEITEDSQLTADLLDAAVEPIRRRGALIAVDDTGAGYANFKHLLRLRPDIVKLDYDMVAGVHQSPEKRALVESLVSFCQRTNSTLCAEGVEVMEELVTLTDLGVRVAQGNFFGVPARHFATTASPMAQEACVRAPSSDGELLPVLARLGAATRISDLALALRGLLGPLRADTVELSLLSQDRLLMVEYESTAAEVVYRVEDFPSTGLCLETGTLLQIRVDDPEADRAEVRLLRALGFGALLLVPVMHNGTGIALIEVYAKGARSWSIQDVRRMADVAAATAGALVRLRGKDLAYGVLERRVWTGSAVAEAPGTLAR